MNRAWSLVLLIGLLGTGCRKDAASAAPAVVPDIYGVLPAFSFSDQTGAPYGSSQLAGKVWIGNTFFTSCHSICPALMKSVTTLAAGLSDTPVHFVSITVDPDNDTPDVLATYAKDRGLDLARWRLLTGPYDATRALVVDGFKTALGAAAAGREPGTDIEHSGKLFLVDAQGRLRGWYPSDAPGLEALAAAARAVLP